MYDTDERDFVSVSSTAYIAFQIIKVDVTPSVRAEINQSNTCLLANIGSHIPGLPSHRLSAFTGRFSDNLKRQKEDRKKKAINMRLAERQMKLQWYLISSRLIRRGYNSGKRKSYMLKSAFSNNSKF